MTPTPSAVSRRTTSKSVSISPSSRIADGSSMISSRTSRDSARAIETICWAAGRSALTFARGGIASWPRRASSAVRLAAHPVEVEQRPAPRLVAEEDALGDRQVLDQVELLVDRRDAARERRRRVARPAAARPSNRISPLVGSHRAGDALDQRRLAGAVRARAGSAPRRPSTSRSTPWSAFTPGYSFTSSRTSRTARHRDHHGRGGCVWAIRRPSSTLLGRAAPHRVLVLDRQHAVEAALVERVDVAAEVDLAEAGDAVAPPAHVPRVLLARGDAAEEAVAVALARGKVSASLACACATRST